MSKSKYPLCEAAGLEVVPKKKIDELLLPQDYVRASEVERMLSEAPVVYGFDAHQGSDKRAWLFDERKNEDFQTHTARLVCIQPVQRDTAESLLRELIELQECDHLSLPSDYISLKNRAKALLEGK